MRSKSGQDLGRYFPEIAVAAVTPFATEWRTILIWNENGGQPVGLHGYSDRRG
jgi:hypothetical protein